MLLLSGGCSGNEADAAGAFGETSGEPADADPPSSTSGDDAAPSETGDDSSGGPGEPSSGRFPGRDRDDGDRGAIPEYCRSAVSDWDPGWAAYELEVIERINAVRVLGVDCGALGAQAPVPALSVDSALVCAARVHAADMAARDYFDHVSPEGEEPQDRLEQAGFTGGAWAENIAAGYPLPSDTVAGWLKSDAHCANLMRADFDAIGLGYALAQDSTYAHYWTLVIGSE